MTVKVPPQGAIEAQGPVAAAGKSTQEASEAAGPGVPAGSRNKE